MLLVGVVRLQVAHLGGGVGEGPVAVLALIGLLSAVDQLVPLQVAGRGEEFAAHLAVVVGLARVALFVQVEQTDQAVTLPAVVTAVGL